MMKGLAKKCPFWVKQNSKSETVLFISFTFSNAFLAQKLVRWLPKFKRGKAKVAVRGRNNTSSAQNGPLAMR